MSSAPPPALEWRGRRIPLAAWRVGGDHSVRRYCRGGRKRQERRTCGRPRTCGRRPQQQRGAVGWGGGRRGMAWGGGGCLRALAVSSSCRRLGPDRRVCRVPRAGGLAGGRPGRPAGGQVGRQSSPGAMHCHGRAGDGRWGAPSSRTSSPAVLFPLPPARRLCAAAAVGALGRRGSEGSSTAALSWGGRPATRQWRRLDRCARGAPRTSRGTPGGGEGAAGGGDSPRRWGK